MKTTRILWSGLTGKVGRAAMKASRERDDVEIVSGICRTRMNDIAAINDVSFEGVKWFRYSDLACDVLEIAKVMATKPAKTDPLYSLESIWDELPHDD